MEETANVTTSSDVDVTSQETQVESTTTEDVVTSEETSSQDTTETSDSTVTDVETKTETTPNWENSYKELQATFTRQSQELAQLKKQVQEQSQPKYVDDKGKVTAEYEQQYRFEVDNREYLTYDQLARQLEPEARAEAERLLQEAKTLYNPNNKSAYNQKLNEIKNYFDSDVVIQIALDKQKLESQMQSEFDRLTQEHKTQKSKEIAEMVEQSEDLKALLYKESENYSEDVFGIVKQMFDLTGGVDLDVINNAVSSIKALGVKEHLAKQKAEAERAKAVVPTGEVVNATNTEQMTADYVRENYQEAVKKLGSMEEADRILMKG